MTVRLRLLKLYHDVTDRWTERATSITGLGRADALISTVK